MRTRTLASVLVALLVLAFLAPAVAAQDLVVPPFETMPTDVYLPAGISPPADLAERVTLTIHPSGRCVFDPKDGSQPTEYSTLLEAIQVKRVDNLTTAFLFAPGSFDAGYTAMKKLTRNRRGTEERWIYIGPLDPTAPLPHVRGDFALSNSWRVLVQGLDLSSSVNLYGVPNEPDGIPCVIEGCRMPSANFRGAQEKDGTPRPAAGTIRKCWIIGGQGQGLYIAHAKNAVIEDNLVDWQGGSKTKDHAIYASRCEGLTIQRNLISRASSSGCKLMDCDNVVFRDNLVWGCHNWITCNGNPSENNPGVQGHNILIEGNVVTSMGREFRFADDSGGGWGYFGWSAKGLTIRGNFFIWSGADRSSAAVEFDAPFYNGEWAGDCEDVLVEGNLCYGYPTFFCRGKVADHLRDLTFKDNVVAEPDQVRTTFRGEERHFWDIPIAYIPEAVPVTGSGNIWPPTYWHHSEAPRFEGMGTYEDVSFSDSSRTLFSFARSKGRTADVRGVAALMHTSDPGQLAAEMLAYFKEGFEVLGTTPADPPEFSPFPEANTREGSTPEPTPEPVPEPTPEPQPEPNPQPGTIAVVRVPDGNGGWIVITITRE